LKSTMSYLARFGYVPDDTLDIIIIADQTSGDLLTGLVDTSHGANLFTMASYDAAKLLNIRLGRLQEGDANYADVLHVAWSARKGSLILPMKSAQVDALTKPRQAAMAASVLLLLSGAFLGYQSFTTFNSLASINNDLEASTNQRAQLDVQYQKELAKKSELGFDVKLVQASINAEKEIESKTIDVIDFFNSVGTAIGKDLRVDSIGIKALDDDVAEQGMRSFSNDRNKPKPLYETTLQISYPSTADIEKGNTEVRDLGDRLSKNLKGYDVKITKLLKDYEYTEGLIVETGDLKTNDLAQDFLAEIKIEGPLMEAKTQ